jgi:NYN domain-containing protein
MRTFAYVDAYNTYYGLKKLCSGSAEQWRWLDVARWIQSQSPRDFEIETVKYFTAEVKPTGWAKAKRQKKYLCALRANGVEVIRGKYETRESEYPLRDNPGVFVWVSRTEEKQSDVNLACHLLLDALVHDDPPEAAIVVSNDSDLTFPIKFLLGRGMPVGVLNPHPERPSGDFHQAATWYRLAKASKVRAAQYSHEITDGGGTFCCPSRWLTPAD